MSSLTEEERYNLSNPNYSKREVYEIQKKIITSKPDVLQLLFGIINNFEGVRVLENIITHTKRTVRLDYPEIIPYITNDVIERQERIYKLWRRLNNIRDGVFGSACRQYLRDRFLEKEMEKWRNDGSKLESTKCFIKKMFSQPKPSRELLRVLSFPNRHLNSVEITCFKYI